MWDEIVYPFPNFNGETVEVWEWKNNFIHALLGMWLLTQCEVIHFLFTITQSQQYKSQQNHLYILWDIHYTYGDLHG